MNEEQNGNGADEVRLVRRGDFLTLAGPDGMSLCADFTKLLPRIRRGNLMSELVVRAVKIRGAEKPLTVLDATAGFAEDSFLLAACGFTVRMYEKDGTIAALLSDALRRASENAELREISARMTLTCGDSIGAMRQLGPENAPDVIYLDPMFPERQKSGLVKKKFQLLHYLEKPEEDGDALLSAALSAHPRKIVIKRPLKGPYLGGVRPSYTKPGKAIRYDMILTDSVNCVI
ncbi:MAG: class I SAM-dependent methyltransferase [Lachnospiraceae bacterium]|jgi:16S rRNA (guanine1516-N2)-methyltransferase